MKSLLARVRAFLSKGVPVSAVLAILALALVPFVLPRLAGSIFSTSQSQVPDGIELTDFIRKVKSDLAAAELEGVKNKEMPLLQLEDVELVAHFVVQSKAESEVKLVAVNANALAGIERSQRITLHFKPIPPQPVEVAPEAQPIVN